MPFIPTKHLSSIKPLLSSGNLKSCGAWGVRCAAELGCASPLLTCFPLHATLPAQQGGAESEGQRRPDAAHVCCACGQREDHPPPTEGWSVRSFLISPLVIFNLISLYCHPLLCLHLHLCVCVPPLLNLCPALPAHHAVRCGPQHRREVRLHAHTRRRLPGQGHHRPSPA